MKDYRQHYVDGAWQKPLGDTLHEVINPANGEAIGRVTLGSTADVDRAVAAAKRAFPSYSRSSVAERRELLQAIISIYAERIDELALTITQEMGAPYAALSQPAQAQVGLAHLRKMEKVLAEFSFDWVLQGEISEHRIVRDAIGVCALITPWNWPLNQIACKVAPALAAGCTMVLKPSEVAPISAHVFADIMDRAGVPAGVFNLIDGAGEVAGAALTAHRDIDMISFTGSTRAGKAISHVAADSVKSLALELGGKSANILLQDCDWPAAVNSAVLLMMRNSGQSCNAPSRLLVPRARLAEVEQLAAAACQQLVVGDPLSAATTLGPLSSREQYDKVVQYIETGLAEGAKLVVGGAAKPDGLSCGDYVVPTVFSEVDNNMSIAREEIFGPVLSIIPYDSEEDAIAIANDSDYGLAAYVSGSDRERAYRVAQQLRAGQIKINDAAPDVALPFGGYKQSGSGREWGAWGLEEFLEIKSISGV